MALPLLVGHAEDDKFVAVMLLVRVAAVVLVDDEAPVGNIGDWENSIHDLTCPLDGCDTGHVRSELRSFGIISCSISRSPTAPVVLLIFPDSSVTAVVADDISWD